MQASKAMSAMEQSQPNDCCRETDRRCSEMRSEFELLKQKMSESEIKNNLYIDSLKECISFRDDLLTAAKNDLEDRNNVITELREQIKESNRKVGELTSTVQELVRELNLLKIPGNRKEENNQTSEDATAEGSKGEKKKTKTKKKQKGSDRIATMEDIFGPAMQPFPRFFILNFCEEGIKRTICPFQFEEDFVSSIVGRPRSITGSGQNGYLIEVESAKQSEDITNLKEVGGNSCTVKIHEFFNGTKGIIYIHGSDISDMDSFKRGLAQEYGVSEVEEAKWIKPRKPSTKAFILTFCNGGLPDTLRIAGEHTLTKVYPHRNKPLHCNRCQAYGHSSKRCSANDFVCRECSDNHPTDQCLAPFKKCANCGGDHPAGHRNCRIYEEECKILEIQSKLKVGRATARDVLSGKQPTSGNQTQIDTNSKYMMITVNRDSLRNVCPFKIEKFLTSNFALKREDISAVKKGFIIKAPSAHQASKLQKLTKIFDIDCTVAFHSSYNSSKGIIYVRDYDIDNLPSFAEGLKVNCGVSEAAQATWIKPKNNNCKAFMISFNQTRTPDSISIPGEQTKTKVYEHIPRPLLCKRCLEYSHTKNHCTNQIRCHKCTEEHLTVNCDRETSKCLHCALPHKTGDRDCPKHRQESSICRIQYTEKISWPSARQKYFSTIQENTYAQRVKKTIPNNRPTPANQPSPSSAARPSAPSTAQHPAPPAAQPSASPRERGTASRRQRESDSSDTEKPESSTKKGRQESQDTTAQLPPRDIIATSDNVVSLSAEDIVMSSSDDETSENSEKVRLEAQKVYDMLTAETANNHLITTPDEVNNSSPQE